MANTSRGQIGSGGNAFFHNFQLNDPRQTNGRTNGLTDGQTNPLIDSLVRNRKP